MRQLRLKLLAGAALSAICAPVTFAQPAPVWTGFYAGANLGYSWGQSDVTGNNFSFGGFGTGGGSQSLTPSGFFGGLQGGYNYQFSRNWVGGLETDFQWSAQEDTANTTTNFNLTIGGGLPPGTATGSVTTTVQSKVSWFGTVRGRIGYVADSMPGLLWYGTGGLAYGRVQTSASAMMTGNYATLGTTNPIDCEGATTGGCAILGALFANDTKTQLGWTLGAGVEILGSAADRWTVKLEYLYVDLGTASGTVPVNGTLCTPVCIPVAGTVTYSNKITDSIVRLGLNYRFWP